MAPTCNIAFGGLITSCCPGKTFLIFHDKKYFYLDKICFYLQASKANVKRQSVLNLTINTKHNFNYAHVKDEQFFLY